MNEELNKLLKHFYEIAAERLKKKEQQEKKRKARVIDYSNKLVDAIKMELLLKHMNFYNDGYTMNIKGEFCEIPFIRLSDNNRKIGQRIIDSYNEKLKKYADYESPVDEYNVHYLYGEEVYSIIGVDPDGKIGVYPVNLDYVIGKLLEDEICLLKSKGESQNVSTITFAIKRETLKKMIGTQDYTIKK